MVGESSLRIAPWCCEVGWGVSFWEGVVGFGGIARGMVVEK